MDLGRWMSLLPTSDRRRPLEEMVLPGSRASLAYSVDLSVLRPVKAKFVRPRHQRRIAEWMFTQKLDILAQLGTGIRALDLRVSAVNNELYVSRRYPISPLIKVLATLKAWVAETREYLEVRVFRDLLAPEDRSLANRTPALALETLSEVRDLLDGVMVDPTPMARQALTLENASGKIALVWGLDSPRDDVKWDLKTITARSTTLDSLSTKVGKYLRHVDAFSDDRRLKVLPLVLDHPDPSPRRKPSPRPSEDDVRELVIAYLTREVHVIEVDNIDSAFVRSVIALNGFSGGEGGEALQESLSG